MVTVGPLKESDWSEWQKLYQAYAEFYRTPMPTKTLELVWSWLHDESHETNALVARDAQSLVGLAHFREFARPLAGIKGLFLDDPFVDPDARGARIGQTLLTAISEEARSRGCPIVRWITADDNYRAHSLYDRMAECTMWVTYDMNSDISE